MAKLDGFNFTRSPLDLLVEGGWNPAVQPFVDSLVEFLQDRDLDTSDAHVLGIQGSRGTATITAALGGAAVVFSSPYDATAMTFQRAPTVFLQMIDGGGADAVVTGGTTTTTGFTAQVYVAGVEQGAGSYTFNWLAVV